MDIAFHSFKKEETSLLTAIWNEIVSEGVAFPGEELYTEKTFEGFLNEQSAVTCLLLEGELAGFYILHPNNIGRCSHVANAGYAISKKFRGRHLGSLLVENSLLEAKRLGFKGMQYNAVVSGNQAAITIYKRVGFEIIGTIPEGFRLKNGDYSDMHIMYKRID